MSESVTDDRLRAYVLTCLGDLQSQYVHVLDETVFSEFGQVGLLITVRQYERCIELLAESGDIVFEDLHKSFPTVRRLRKSGVAGDLQPQLFPVGSE